MLSNQAPALPTSWLLATLQMSGMVMADRLEPPDDPTLNLDVQDVRDRAQHRRYGGGI